VYRLPTEAEWEYACRGGIYSAPFSFGLSLSSTQAAFDGTGPYGGAARGPNRKQTTTVGSFPANAFGLFDMHGNIEEWCADWYGAYPAERQTDPTGPPRGLNRVSRGGGWNSYGSGCRAAHRNRGAPRARGGNTGFRVACNPPGGK
jgi:formylglycine-generating enzyme required for sulfatase activity